MSLRIFLFSSALILSASLQADPYLIGDTLYLDQVTVYSDGTVTIGGFDDELNQESADVHLGYDVQTFSDLDIQNSIKSPLTNLEDNNAP